MNYLALSLPFPLSLLSLSLSTQSLTLFPMSYSLTLSPFELESLAQITDWGYFPTELYDCLLWAMPEGQPRHEAYEAAIPEHVAWSLTGLRESDPDSYLACLSGDLKERVIELELAIV